MKKIVIIGAGFSGSLCAIQLLNQATVPLHIILIDKHDFGRGVAYQLQDESLLLNVRADNMSAFPDSPSHFLDWLKAHGFEVTPQSLVSRKIYGDYISSLLNDKRSKLEFIQEEVTRISEAVYLKNNQSINADKIILACGLDFPAVDFKRILTQNEDITIMGTGLSMVDLVVYLDKHHFEKKITAVSRHGRLPSTHHFYGSEIQRPSFDFSADKSLAFVFSQFKSALKNFEWRLVIDALRPHTQLLWQSFSIEDKRQFLRHCRSLWDVHRHRMSPDHKLVIDRKVQDGSLEIIRAGFGKYTPRTPFVVSLTGLSFDSSNGLIHQLISDQKAEKDPLALGLKTDGEGRLNSQIYTLGPLRRGELWECTAVPEIRKQASDLASLILKEL